MFVSPSFSQLFLLLTSSSSREETTHTTDKKWLMRLGNTEDDKINPGKTNEDCLGAIEEEWKGNHCGNGGLNNHDNALKRLLRRDQYQKPSERKRTKSYLTRAGKRAVAGEKEGTFYLTRAGKRESVSNSTRLVRVNTARAQRKDRSYLTRAGKRGNFYLTGKRSDLDWRAEKKKDKSYLTRAGKRSRSFEDETN